MKNYQSTDPRCVPPDGKGHRFVFFTPMNPIGYCFVCEAEEYERSVREYEEAIALERRLQDARIREIVRQEIEAQGVRVQ